MLIHVILDLEWNRTKVVLLLVEGGTEMELGYGFGSGPKVGVNRWRGGGTVVVCDGGGGVRSWMVPREERGRKFREKESRSGSLYAWCV